MNPTAPRSELFQAFVALNAAMSAALQSSVPQPIIIEAPRTPRGYCCECSGDFPAGEVYEACAEHQPEPGETVYCGDCAGSGQGRHESLSCRTCRGSGEVLAGCYGGTD